VAVRLAAQDGSANVIYLGRPCQFSKGLREGKEGKACPEKYWTTHRFAPEIIAAYKAALDNIKAYHDVTGFHIVGYGGGGTIAALLAVERSDILTLRTVAGNLDPKTSAWTRNITEPTGSLNPINYASKLVNMPQRHFIGKLDQVIAPAVYNSYAQALGNSPCLSVTMVDQADHQLGWVEQWNKLKDLPAVCNKPVELPPAKFDPATLDGDKGLGVK
jgi:dienelactone hydrolase